MLQLKTLFALSLFAASCVHAADKPPIVFERDGDVFEYQARLDQDLVKIEGKVLSNGDEFSLTVTLRAA